MPTPEIRDTKATPDSTISPVVTEPEKPVEPPTEPIKPPVVAIPEVSDRRVAICNRMGEIIAENGGLVSNIPVNRGGEYWQLKAELDALRAAP